MSIDSTLPLESLFLLRSPLGSPLLSLLALMDHSGRLSFLLVFPPGPCIQLRNGLRLPKRITHLYVPDHRGRLKSDLVRINLRIYAKNKEEGDGRDTVLLR